MPKQFPSLGTTTGARLRDRPIPADVARSFAGPLPTIHTVLHIVHFKEDISNRIMSKTLRGSKLLCCKP